MKKTLVTFFIIIVLTGGVINCAVLKDVATNHWAYEAVNFLVENGILSGMPDGTFKGNDSTTRYQTAIAIFRTIQYLKSGNNIQQGSIETESINYKLDSMQNLVESMANSMEKIGREYQIILDRTGYTGEIGNSDKVDDDEELIALRKKVTDLELREKGFSDAITMLNSEIESLNSNCEMNTLKIKQLEFDDVEIKEKMADMDSRLNIMTWVSVGSLVVGVTGIVIGVMAMNKNQSDQ